MPNKLGKEDFVNFVEIPFAKRNETKRNCGESSLENSFIEHSARDGVTGKTAPCRRRGRVRKCWRERERRPVNRVFFFFSLLFFASLATSAATRGRRKIGGGSWMAGEREGDSFSRADYTVETCGRGMNERTDRMKERPRLCARART